jgi:hypothetical protein
MSASRITVVNGIGQIDKTAASTLDYTFDCTSWLATISDKIVSALITVDGESGIVLNSSNFNDNIVVAWISGGTKFKTATVFCKITTNSVPARTETFKLQLNIT